MTKRKQCGSIEHMKNNSMEKYAQPAGSPPQYEEGSPWDPKNGFDDFAELSGRDPSETLNQLKEGFSNSIMKQMKREEAEARAAEHAERGPDS